MSEILIKEVIENKGKPDQVQHILVLCTDCGYHYCRVHEEEIHKKFHALHSKQVSVQSVNDEVKK